MFGFKSDKMLECTIYLKEIVFIYETKLDFFPKDDQILINKLLYNKMCSLSSQINSLPSKTSTRLFQNSNNNEGIMSHLLAKKFLNVPLCVPR